MARYDGSIRIDTRVDSSGFNKGIKTISNGFAGIVKSLKGIAIAAGLAFGIKAAIDFGKASVSAASELSNALIGLQSILERQGRSFQKAKEFIEEYTSDGLISATEAINSYKNLVLRGYTDSQVQQVLIALKDSAAFGRQANYTLGGAVETATEGLKNENSVLVDNAGVTKNVAKMWDDYAKSIGTNVNNLTKQQKIQAEVIGILEETKYQTGDAAKIANSYSGQVLQLSFAFNNLKVAVGNILMPILQKVIPVIKTIIDWFTRLANAIGSVTAVLFGKVVKTNEQVTSGAAAAAESTSGLAEAEKEAGNAAEKAGKQAKSALAAFDELNVLAKNTDSNNSDNGTADDTGTVGGGVAVEDVTGIDEDSKLSDTLERLKEKMQPVIEKARELYEALKVFDEHIGEGLRWFWDNVIRPFGEWCLTEVLTRFLATTTLLVEGLDTVLQGFKKAFGPVWDNFLKPLAGRIGEAIINVWDHFNECLSGFIELLKQSDVWENLGIVLGKLGEVLGPVAEGFVAIWENVMEVVTSAVFLFLTDQFKNLEDVIGAIADLINGDFKGASEHLRSWLERMPLMGLNWKVIFGLTDFTLSLVEMSTEWVNKVTKWWDEDVTPWFTLAKWEDVYNSIVEAIKTKLEEFKTESQTKLTEWWSTISEWFTLDKWKTLYNSIVEAIKAKLEDLKTESRNKMTEWWGEISEWFTFEKWEELGKNMKDGLTTGFKSVVEGIIGFLNKIIDGFETLVNDNVINTMNELIDTFNVLAPIDIPKLKEVEFGRIPIPKLATGAVIPPNQQFMAILGDQKTGRNLEAPEGLIRQIMREELAGLKTDTDVTINFEGNLAQLARVLNPVITKEQKRVGTSLKLGGAFV